MTGWLNTQHTWGWWAIAAHWVVAVLVFGLYALGWWMVDLDYYSGWYRTAPFIHKSIGILLFVLVLLRVLMRVAQVSPEDLPTHGRIERVLARCAHGALYVLLLVVCVSGYLISTADGRAISVFDLFSVPAVIEDIDNLEDLAGEVHELSTNTLVILALFHALAGLKHHFMDRDATLRRMLGLRH